MEKWCKTSTNQNSTIFLKVQQTLLFKRKTCSQQFFNPNWNFQALTINHQNKSQSSKHSKQKWLQFPNTSEHYMHITSSFCLWTHLSAGYSDSRYYSVCCSCSDDKHISSFQKLNYLLCPVPICHTRLPCSGEFYRPAEEEPLCILRGCWCRRCPSWEPRPRWSLFPTEAGNYFLGHKTKTINLR